MHFVGCRRPYKIKHEARIENSNLAHGIQVCTSSKSMPRCRFIPFGSVEAIEQSGGAMNEACSGFGLAHTTKMKSYCREYDRKRRVDAKVGVRAVDA